MRPTPGSIGSLRMRLLPVFIGLALAVLPGRPAAAEWDAPLAANITAVAEKTFVTVECVSRFEGMGQSRELPRSLSGLVVSSTGLVMVLQNVEVVSRMGSNFALSPPEKIQILFPDRSRVPGSYIGADPDLNVSFFAIEPADSPYSGSFLTFSENTPSVGDVVAACRMLGEEYEPRYEAGFAHVSTVLTKPQKSYMTQPPLTAFNGFPVFDSEARVVGVVMAEDGSAESAALSMLTGQISVQASERFLHLIKSPPSKATERGWLGIRMEPLNQDLGELWEIPGPGGIIVTSTLGGSPAEEYGLLAEDVIVQMDGNPLPVRNDADLNWFRQYVRVLNPGDELNLQVVRGASSFGRKPREILEIKLKLGVSPPSLTEAETITLPEIGLKVRALTLDVLFARRLPEDMKGVIADYVESAGPANIGELREDDIILSISGVEMTDLASVDEFFQTLREEKPDELIFHVLRGNSRLFLKVSPIWD